MKKQIRATNAVATYCPRVRQWRIVEFWGGGRMAVRFADTLDEARFIAQGAGWPGVHGYSSHARTFAAEEKHIEGKGAVKAVRDVAKYRRLSRV